jgi:hypothetical protein
LFRDIPPLYFFSDDFVWLLEAKHDTAEMVPTYFTESHGFFYRPITKLYFWGMWQVAQDSASAYHLVNIGVHILVSIAVYVFSLQLIRRVVSKNSKPYAARVIAFGTTLLYFVHPAHLENIIWPSAVTELIPALCVLVGLIIFIWSLEKSQKWLQIVIYGLFIVGLGARTAGIPYRSCR